MTPSISVGCFWSGRAETLHDCARRLVVFKAACEELEELNFNLQSISTDSEGECHSLTEVSLESAVQILSKGGFKNDMGVSMSNLGFSATISADCDGTPISILLHCGSTTPHLKNSCVAAIPEVLVQGRESEVQSRLVGIMHAIIGSWSPDEGRVVSSSILKWNGKVDLAVPRIGWITYLAPKYGDPPELPPPSRIERLSNGGHLFYATEDWPDVNAPKDAAALLRVKEVVHTMARRLNT